MKNRMIRLIRWYQRVLSPLKGRPCCRFYPTCSQYAIDAFTKRGFFVGLGLTVWRLLRCNPLFRGGVEYVPDPPKKRASGSVRYAGRYAKKAADPPQADPMGQNP